MYLLLLLQAKTAGEEKCQELFTPIVSHLQSLSFIKDTISIGEENYNQAGKASKLAKTCLHLMSFEHIRWTSDSYEEWKPQFSHTQTIFPDSLVATLGTLVTKQNNYESQPYRLQELEERKQAMKQTSYRGLVKLPCNTTISF